MPATMRAEIGIIRRRLLDRWNAFRKRLIFRLINLWPPYRGAGIRVRRLDLAAGVVEVEMRLRWWNRNYVGTHFGGSLYSMTDPFFMLILIERLGRGFVVWDKSGTIRYRRPGRGRVRVRFQLTDDEIEQIRSTAMKEGKAEPHFVVRILDEDDQTVAEVEKVVHVKREKKKR